jgi:hypothetical protein
VLVVAPAALLHPAVPQPDGSALYELLTGHPDRAPHELVFAADLTCELRAWPTDTWAKVGINPQAAARAVVAGWRRGDLPGLRVVGLTAEEALALERPAMTYVREQLRQRLARQVGQAYLRWLHPTSGRRPGQPLPVAADTRRQRQCPRWTAPSGHRPPFRQRRGHRALRQPSGRRRRTPPQPAVDSSVDRPAIAHRRRTLRPSARLLP